MTKKAFLVGFCPQTRVVADVPDDFDGNLNSPEGEKIIEAARKQIMADPVNYLYGENCDRLEEDLECPYKEDTSPVLTGKDGKRYTETYFHCRENIGAYNDSMELDSGQELVRLVCLTENGYKAEAGVMVTGDVKVIFRDETYRCASNMPEELLDCFHNGTCPEDIIVSEGNGDKYETPYFCDMNNWLEAFVTISNPENENEIHLQAYDTYDVIDFIEDNTPEGWKRFLLEQIEAALEDL